MNEKITWRDIVKPGLLIGNLDQVEVPRSRNLLLVPTNKSKSITKRLPRSDSSVTSQFRCARLTSSRISRLNEYFINLGMGSLSVHNSQGWTDDDIATFFGEAILDSDQSRRWGHQKLFRLGMELDDYGAPDAEVSITLPLETALGVTTGNFVCTSHNNSPPILVIWHEIIMPNQDMCFLPFRIDFDVSPAGKITKHTFMYLENKW